MVMTAVARWLMDPETGEVLVYDTFLTEGIPDGPRPEG